ncbi:hypothetical protein [Calditerrivibrio sp.]|jgi:hypothetical protein|uniref:hypothetical protein n=1 Tax=Calditerrivibrio sp. TaxID=2792612 RepID=UPI003D124191
MKRLTTLVSLFTISLLIFGCSQNTVKEDASTSTNKTETTSVQKTAPADNEIVNPHGDGNIQPKQPKPIVVPDEVAKKYKAVKINIISVKDNKTISVNAPIGQETKVPNTPLVLFVEAYLPDFNMGTENITSLTAEEKNPAVKVKIAKGENRYEGWLFKNFEIHKIEDPDYEFKLEGGITK